MRKFIPWQLKIATKILLSRLPISYREWAGLGLFKLGEMENPEHAIKIFFLHLEAAYARKIPEDAVFLEMGPGDSVASAICAAACNAAKVYLVDVGNFATTEMNFYRQVSSLLHLRGLKPPALPQQAGFQEMLEICRAEYLTGGLESLRGIPDDSIDYAWSHSMMEHVRKKEFEKTVREHFRILKRGGIVSHSIDLQDHLGGKLNNLRFAEGLWESDFMENSGFYTNRLRASEIIDAFRRCGFTVRKEGRGRWPAIPTPRRAMDKAFRACAEDDLLTRTLSVILEKP